MKCLSPGTTVLGAHNIANNTAKAEPKKKTSRNHRKKIKPDGDSCLERGKRCKHEAKKRTNTK